VGVNHRLNVFGYTYLGGLSEEYAVGNAGQLDLIAALQWVRDNIGNFGGDPGNVTILGQSAGGKSVMALFASPLAHGLFQKGVAMSQYGIPDATRAKAIDAGSKVASALGLNGADATAAELRAVPAEKFGQLKDQGLSLAPVPISGDSVLPQPIQDTFDAGNEAPLPLIVGDTSDDASVITGFGVDPAKVIQSMRSAGMILKVLYPGVKGDKELGSQVVRDVVFTFPAKWVADRHSKLAPTWRYYFDYTAVKQRANFPHGVPHGAEIVYVLDTAAIYPDTKHAFTQQDLKYERKVSEYFFEFAKSGTPSCAGSAAWPSHSGGHDKTMHFGETIVVQTNFMKARMNVFSGASKLLGGMLSKK